MKVTAVSPANIALIKYWGMSAPGHPQNPSLSMTFDSLLSTTTVEDGHPQDSVELNGEPAAGTAKERILAHLSMMKELAGCEEGVKVVSRNNFPTGAGVASSASGFSALTLALSKMLSLDLSTGELASLSAFSSGSSARSFLDGWVVWEGGSRVRSVAGPEHWDLVDLVLVVSREHKTVHSAEGNRLASTSPLNRARVEWVRKHLHRAVEAVKEKRLGELGRMSEEDAVMMHAVMMTSEPPLFYWNGRTLDAIEAVHEARRRGMELFFTVDAGPNVHVLTERGRVGEVREFLEDRLESLEILVSGPGKGTRVTGKHLF